MGHAPDESTLHLAERWCWESVRRDDWRVARRLYRRPRVDGVHRLDEGTWLEDCLHGMQASGVMARLEDVQGAAIPRERLFFGQDGPALGDEDPGGDSKPPCQAPRAVQ
jgi:hypothetical protein